MRDVNRIPMLMWKLQEYWMRNPDLRLGQMMIIAEKRLELDDVWNVEDEELIEALVEDYNEDDDAENKHSKYNEIVFFKSWMLKLKNWLKNRQNRRGRCEKSLEKQEQQKEVKSITVNKAKSPLLQVWEFKLNMGFETSPNTNVKVIH